MAVSQLSATIDELPELGVELWWYRHSGGNQKIPALVTVTSGDGGTGNGGNGTNGNGSDTGSGNGTGGESGDGKVDDWNDNLSEMPDC